MDGLALSEQILKQVSAKVFLLTSYRDFDYVKKGMQIGVTDYILKNELTEETLGQLLRKTSQDIYIERKEQYRILEHNVRHFLLSDPAFQEDLVYKDRPMQRYALIRVTGLPVISIHYLERRNMLALDCYELRELAYPDGLKCSAFTEIEGMEVCGIFFIQEQATDGQPLLQEACGKLLEYLQAKGIEGQCLISDTRYHFFDLQNSYRELKKLSDYTYAYQGKRIFQEKELKKKRAAGGIQDNNFEKLAEELDNRNRDGARAYLDDLFCKWRENLTCWEYMENFQGIYRYMRSYIRRKNLRPAIMEIPEVYENCESAEQMLKGRLDQISREMSQDQDQEMQHSAYVQKALAFIHLNYGRDISIPDIAQAAGISEGHLRRLFKQELNTKVVDYLMEYRLECAKLRMKNKKENLSEIWKNTGFTSAQYFSYVFKRKEGMLPREYMMKVRNDQ
jgi:YesN/AraC family two-component response regulator